VAAETDVEICTDAEAAGQRSAAGVDVVLVLPEGVSYDGERRGPGRVSVFVSGHGGPVEVAAATAMGLELAGARVWPPASARR